MSKKRNSNINASSKECSACVKQPTHFKTKSNHILQDLDSNADLGTLGRNFQN